MTDNCIAIKNLIHPMDIDVPIDAITMISRSHNYINMQWEYWKQEIPFFQTYLSIHNINEAGLIQYVTNIQEQQKKQTKEEREHPSIFLDILQYLYKTQNIQHLDDDEIDL
jgi:hypothetical protein